MSSSAGSGRSPSNTAAAAKTKVSQNKPNTRKAGAPTTTILSKEDVRNAVEGRRFLERKLLLCPAGEPITNVSLAYCLHQISESGGISNLIANAVRAAAFLAEELEENSVNIVVRDAVLSQLGELTQDMKSLVEDAKEKIDSYVHSKSLETTLPLPTSPPGASAAPGGPTQRTYAQALINPPPHADPRLAAREGIRARQIMLEGIDPTSKFGHLNGAQFKVEVNKILGQLGLEGKGIRSATIQKNKGVLIEMEDDYAAGWVSKPENQFSLCVEIGPDVVVKPHVYSVIALNAPLTINPDSREHQTEIGEVNHFGPEKLAAIRWVKPITRRTPEQKSAHLLLSFTDVSTANRAIADGLMICNKRVRVEKMKREPTRCLKCQGWNHQAHECISQVDKCGSCAEDHRTSQCPQPRRTKCVSCNVDDHASWSRLCPAFQNKISECNSRNPENALQFFPTLEPWTWTPRPESKTDRPRQHDIYRPRQHDIYRPNYPPNETGWNAMGPSDKWNIDLPPSRSWDDDTPYDGAQLIQRSTTTGSQSRDVAATQSNA
jgi:hypothetical protein